MAEKINLALSAYYSENSRRIHLLFEDFRSTVSDEAGRANYHPELFRKLAQRLREAGVSAPNETDNA